MAEEPENLVVVQLREIRATLSEHSSRFDRVDERFDRIDRRFDDFHMLVSHALGLATANQLKTRELEADQEEVKARQRRMHERHAEIERRLGRIEETSES